MCDFKPGDEVVCVDAGWFGFGWKSYLGVAFPLKRGGTYTVSGVRVIEESENAPPKMIGTIAVHIQGHPNVSMRGQDIGFAAHRFRKVQRKSTETGMAMLQGLLDGKDVSAPVVEIA
jgi:hypothetical protein